MMDPAGKLVRIRGLRKIYGNTRALDDIDLDLRSGEVLGIAGPNGAGKSTLIRILAGEERADSGEIWIDDTPWTKASADAVAVVHQEPQLFPNLTVAENLMVGREGTRFRTPRLGVTERDLMSALGLSAVASRTLSSCALATQQRTEIARALARQSTIFLFDEPNSALTPEDSRELFAEIHRLADASRIVILVTHRLGDLVEHADRVAIVRDGSRNSWSWEPVSSVKLTSTRGCAAWGTSRRRFASADGRRWRAFSPMSTCRSSAERSSAFLASKVRERANC
jgi:ABC-type sugar transport system ATPase subunit